MYSQQTIIGQPMLVTNNTKRDRQSRENQLTRKAQIVSKVRLHHILAKRHPVGSTRQSLLANSKAHHGRDGIELMEEGLMVRNDTREHGLMDVDSGVVAHVHSATGALNSGPVDDVTDGEVGGGIGGPFLKLEATVKI